MTQPTTDYLSLRQHVEDLLTLGRTQSRQAGEWEKVAAYWQVGDALLAFLGDQPRAGYGEQTVGRLSQDLGLPTSLLWDLLRFRRALPELRTYRRLTWSHVRDLLPLPTQDQRRYYLQRANREAWSVRQLRDALAADAYARATSQPYAVPPDADPDLDAPLRARFGSLWTYRVLPGAGPDASDWDLDLGFTLSAATALTGIAEPHPDLIVTAARDAEGRYTFAPRPANTRRYTYLAWVKRVVDGDTLIADVDLGLRCRARAQRLRLRGIDCPELHTLAGRNARDFVAAALADVPFVVVTTFRTDNYGRYLADLRYLPRQLDPELVRANGIYLNRQLLDERLARRYPG